MLHALRKRFSAADFILIGAVVAGGIFAGGPRFASARSDMMRSSLADEIVRIDAAIAEYARQHDGRLPTVDPNDPLGPTGSKQGWGVLASDAYLSKTPDNPFAASDRLVRFDPIDLSQNTSGAGWAFVAEGGQLSVYPLGRDVPREFRAPTTVDTE